MSYICYTLKKVRGTIDLTNIIGNNTVRDKRYGKLKRNIGLSKDFVVVSTIFITCMNVYITDLSILCSIHLIIIDKMYHFIAVSNFLCVIPHPQLAIVPNPNIQNVPICTYNNSPYLLTSIPVTA